MRVMVTGGTGFIGYHTVRALLAAGLEVSLLVRSADKLHAVYGEGVIEHYTCGDIADPVSVGQAMEGCDAVIHVAALVSTHAADAERVYREDLAKWRGNGWSLYGYTRALEGQGKTAEASNVRRQYLRTWQRADEPTTTSCKCISKT